VVDTKAGLLQNVILFPPQGAFIVDSGIGVSLPARAMRLGLGLGLGSGVGVWGVGSGVGGWGLGIGPLSERFKAAHCLVPSPPPHRFNFSRQSETETQNLKTAAEP